MLEELFMWAPWAACTFGSLTGLGIVLAVFERYIQNCDDESNNSVEHKEMQD